MNGKWTALMVLFLMGVLPTLGAAPITVEIVEVKIIWDKAPHNAFTDMLRWNDRFYCAFREGREHVSADGKIRVLESKDANLWESVGLVMLEGYDLRDPHLSVTPDGRLMLLGGAAPRKQDNQRVPTGTFVCFSKDGRQWSKPQIAVEPGRWLWCVTWYEGKAYGMSYAAGESMPYLDLLISSDGANYQSHVAKLFGEGYPTEVTLRFDTNGICYALVRRDRFEGKSGSTLLGVSKPDYEKWSWHDLGQNFTGGPNLIQIPGGHWIGAGRMHEGGTHTALTCIDVENGTMTKLVTLPSGGDTSYPGLVWHENMLYVSYYSSHEGKTSIYLAKLNIKPKVAVGKSSIVAGGAKMKKLAGGFKFTEGPAADVEGNIFFSDIPNNRINKWSLEGVLSTFREDSGGANGLFFDKAGNLIACEGGRRQLVAITPDGKIIVLADSYGGKRLNSPNDLWITPAGGIYFTDPRYGSRDDMQQGGEHVYYLSADRKKLIRVIDDMVRPNGLIGTADGKLLYVSDRGAKKTYVYKVNPDGTLLDKKFFAAEGSDGMTIDNRGNIYLTTEVVSVYDSAGNRIEAIEVPETPANVCFGGSDKQTLFITARTSLYSLQMQVKGL